MLFHSLIVPLQTKNENSTTCRALLVFVNSKTKYEHKSIGSDLSINVLNDRKPNFSCSAEKGNLSPDKIFLHEGNRPNFKNFALSTRKEKFFGN